jgi:hypothetical protein
MSAARQNANPVLRKLESIFRLSEVERAAVEALPMQVQTITADQDIVHDLVCLADLPSTGSADPTTRDLDKADRLRVQHPEALVDGTIAPARSFGPDAAPRQ